MSTSSFMDSPHTTRDARGRAVPTFSTIAAITIGNGLEFFDFTVYAFFVTIWGPLFFPSTDPLTQFMLAVGSYGISFVARPIGGVVLGLFGDRAGRKPAMTLTLVLMAVGSLGVACAPTYAQVGVLATIWLITARLIQGFALGGEVGASTALLLEYADDNSRGYYGSWQFFSQGVSSLLGAALATILTTTLSHDAFFAWGWRIPFAIGVLMVPLGVYIRRHLDETLGPKTDRSGTLAKLAEVFQTNGRTVVAGILLIIGGTIATYLIVFYIPAYAEHFLHMPRSVTSLAGVISSLMIVLLAPWVGRLTDRWGRIPNIAWPRLLLVLLVLPAFMLIGAYPTGIVLGGVVAVLAALLVWSAVPAIVLITEMTPRPIRATATSIIYSVGVAVFGGTSQLVATWLIGVTNNQLAPAWYLIGGTLVSSVPLLWLKETRGRPA